MRHYFKLAIPYLNHQSPGMSFLGLVLGVVLCLLSFLSVLFGALEGLGLMSFALLLISFSFYVLVNIINVLQVIKNARRLNKKAKENSFNRVLLGGFLSPLIGAILSVIVFCSLEGKWMSTEELIHFMLPLECLLFFAFFFAGTYPVYVFQLFFYARNSNKK